MIIFSCEKGCENMNYVKYHVNEKDARRNNAKYHVKKSVKLKLQGQKCMAFNLPPLASSMFGSIYIIQSFSCCGLEPLLTL